MKLFFQLQCTTKWGQEVLVDVADQLIKLQTGDGHHWTGFLDFKGKLPSFVRYQYLIIEDDLKSYEFGEKREVNSSQTGDLLLRDVWRGPSHDNSLYTAPFLNAFFQRTPSTGGKEKLDGAVIFKLRAIRVNKHHQVGILGSSDVLGRWDINKVVLLRDTGFPEWKVSLDIDPRYSFEYKYVIYSKEEQRIITWEEGDNRVFHPVDNHDDRVVQTDEYFRYPSGNWKAAGVVLPVFSLRSENSAGVGEFLDIPLMVNWAVMTGMKVFQVLPINDTVANHSWTDSYPYAAISVHALHPIYANMEAIGRLRDSQRWEEIEREAIRLNSKKELDFVEVMKLKSAFFKLSYDENRDSFVNSRELVVFLEENKTWIHGYAAFSCLRDKYGTPDFTQWGEHYFMSDDEVLHYVSPRADHYDDVAVHYYIQYHLDKQLKAATQYARERGVVLKGDIPIGIYRHSVDAWRKPHLFHLDKQAGAPPDMFSTTGQNWGFPTYNWEVMKENGYAWWMDRLAKMKEYFDMVRIDHILGFFRIWQMKAEDIQGLLGAFYPSLPMSREEIISWGIPFEEVRYCQPYLPDQLIRQWAGTHESLIKAHFLTEEQGFYYFKPAFTSQRKIASHVYALKDKGLITEAEAKELTLLIFKMQSEVLFIKDEEVEGYHPRIEMFFTHSFAALDEPVREQMSALHEHFYHHRHNEFWKQSGLEKLPAVKHVTNMLVCGEDLGMVPASVPGVMDDLQILRLYVQRNPDYPGAFQDPGVISYLSVKSSGNHDVETLRQWWGENEERNKWIFHELLDMDGEVPQDFTQQIAEKLMDLHFQSNSMLAINPLQDYMTLSESLRRKEMEEERINVPENPQHAWCYRFHMNMEDLCRADEFNQKIRRLVERSGRLSD